MVLAAVRRMFAQSNRTFVRMAERQMGIHNAIKRTGRPTVRPRRVRRVQDLVREVPPLCPGELAQIHERGSGDGCASWRYRRVTQPYGPDGDYQEDEFGKFQKGNDDAVDALIGWACSPWRSNIGSSSRRCSGRPARTY